MAYTVSPGAVLEASLVARLFGQRIMIVRHYWINPSDIGDSSDGGADLVEFMSLWDAPVTGLTELLSTYATTELLFESIRAQWIYPQRWSYKTKVPEKDAGTQAPPTMPQNTTIVLTLQTQAAGARGRGNVFFTGWEASVEDGGYATALAKGHMNAMGDFFMLSHGPLASGITLQPIIYHRADPPNSYVVDHYHAQDVVRTMKRRTVGHGI